MWGFFILLTVYIEAYGVLFQPDFALPVIGHWDVLGVLQDFFALAVATGIVTFAIIRLRTEPKEYGRQSRFYGSHTGARLARPVHDLQRHLDVRRLSAEHRSIPATSPTAGARSSPTSWAHLTAPLGHNATRSSRPSR